MARVTLRAMFFPGNERHMPGDVIDVDDETLAHLEAAGAIARPEPAAPDPAPGPGTLDDPVEDTEPGAPMVKRPARTAPVDTWRAYAEAQGIDPKGLSKAELIAATN